MNQEERDQLFADMRECIEKKGTYGPSYHAEIMQRALTALETFAPDADRHNFIREHATVELSDKEIMYVGEGAERAREWLLVGEEMPPELLNKSVLAWWQESQPDSNEVEIVSAAFVWGMHMQQARKADIWPRITHWMPLPPPPRT